VSVKVAAPLTDRLQPDRWLLAQEQRRRQRRRVRITTILCWSLALIGLGWLLASAILGLSSAV
jgi:hypothetical protein